MKKRKFITALLAIGMTLFGVGLAACDKKETPSTSNETPSASESGETSEHVCVFGEWVVTTPADCSKTGLKARSCECGETETEVLEKTEHKNVIKGAQAAVAATCTQEGRTAGDVCQDCNTLVNGGTTIPALGHSTQQIPVKGSTCAEDGYTAGEKCSRCQTVLSGLEVIPATGIHTPEAISAKEPTCGEAGHTAGEQCSVCHTVLTATEPVAATGEHSYGEFVVLSQPAYEVEGEQKRVCSECQHVDIQKIPALTYRPEDIWDGTVASGFALGTGTQADPYIISTAAEFAYFKNNALYFSYNSTNEAANTHFKLANDIMLNEITDFDTWGTTAPTNSFSPISGFGGVLDGDGHAVRGLYYANKTASKAGLFMDMIGGSIRNLTVSECYINAPAASVGGIVSHISTTRVMKIENCHFSGSLLGANGTGGIVGYAQVGSSQGMNEPIYGALSIQNCSAKGAIATVKSTTETPIETRVGGILGHSILFHGALSVTTCKNEAKIEGYRAGGIVGDNEWKTSASPSLTYEISGCSNKGEIVGEQMAGGIAGRISTTDFITLSLRNHQNDGKITGLYAGGIIGYASIKLVAINTYDALYNLGDIYGSGSSAYAGGLFGNFGGNGSYAHNIERSLNEGKIESSGYAGGLSGENTGNGFIYYTECYNAGAVSGVSYAGGFAGTDGASAVTYTDCYNRGTVTGGTSVGGMTGYFSNGILEVYTSYTVGKVSLTEDATSSAQIGAIFGGKGTYATFNCLESKPFYYLIGSALKANGADSYAYAGRNPDLDTAYRRTEQGLQNSAQYRYFNFSSIWEIDGEGEYKYATLKNVKKPSALA